MFPMKLRMPLLVVALLSPAAPARADLKLSDIKAVHGPLGPVRESLDVTPGDEIYFRYTVSGVRVDEDGRPDLTLRIQLRDEDGELLLDQDSRIRGLLALGGGTFLGSANVSTTTGVAAGKYPLKVTVTDALAGESAEFERTLTFTKPKFDLVRIRFTHDADGAVRATAGGALGQSLFIQGDAVGFGREDGRVRVTSSLVILDEKGEPTMPEPLRVEFDADPERAATLNVIHLSNQLQLNRVGRFRVRLTATDEVTGKQVEFAAPLHVTAPVD